MSYQDNNAIESVSPEKGSDSRALNPANIVHLESADTSPNEPKQFVVDDFLCTMYSPGTNSPERPNMSGLYGKQRGV
jgi:hypothetical protein